MNKALGLAFVVAGLALIVFGINASDSLGSDITRFFTGTPTDKSMWLLIGGIAAAVLGLVLSGRRSVKS